LFKPREPYKRCIRETFKGFPPSALPLIDNLLAIDPVERKTASDALKSEVGFIKNS
jgi:cyclin-dependent kinase 12/13